MARVEAMWKPGERARKAGTYYCHICSLRGEESTCEVQGGQMFTECPRCLERQVPEWDMTWKAEADRPGKPGRSAASHWPGSLARRV